METTETQKTFLEVWKGNVELAKDAVQSYETIVNAAKQMKSAAIENQFTTPLLNQLNALDLTPSLRAFITKPLNTRLMSIIDHLIESSMQHHLFGMESSNFIEFDADRLSIVRLTADEVKDLIKQLAEKLEPLGLFVESKEPTGHEDILIWMSLGPIVEK